MLPCTPSNCSRAVAAAKSVVSATTGCRALSIERPSAQLAQKSRLACAKCTASTQASQGQWDGCNFTSLLIGRVNAKNLAQTSPQTGIMPLRERPHQVWAGHSEQRVCSTIGAMEDQRPRRLRVWHLWDAFQKSVVVTKSGFEVRCRKVWTSPWRSQDSDALVPRGQS